MWQERRWWGVGSRVLAPDEVTGVAMGVGSMWECQRSMDVVGCFAMVLVCFGAESLDVCGRRPNNFFLSMTEKVGPRLAGNCE